MKQPRGYGGRGPRISHLPGEREKEEARRQCQRLYLSGIVEGAEHNCEEEGGTVFSVPTHAEITDGGSSQIQALGI